MRRLAIPMAFVTALMALMALTVLACGPVVERTMPKSWIGTDKSRLSTWFVAADQVEAVPAGVRPDTVRDEAVLAAAGDDETCFALTLRTAVDYDISIDEHALECAVGSNIAMPAITGERVAVRDYGQGGAQRVVLEPIPVADFRNATLNAPADGDFRVVERTAEVCCPLRTFNYVELSLVNPLMTVDLGYGPMPFGTSFAWQIQQGR